MNLGWISCCASASSYVCVFILLGLSYHRHFHVRCCRYSFFLHALPPFFFWLRDGARPAGAVSPPCCTRADRSSSSDVVFVCFSCFICSISSSQIHVPRFNFRGMPPLLFPAVSLCQLFLLCIDYIRYSAEFCFISLNLSMNFSHRNATQIAKHRWVGRVTGQPLWDHKDINMHEFMYVIIASGCL